MSMRSMFQGMVVVGCIAATSTAFADNPAATPYVFPRPNTREAQAHLRRGWRLYNNQGFEEAITEFKAGALVEPSPAFDYNLGQSYRQLGKYKEALWHYERFVAHGKPTGEVLEAVQRWITEMQQHLANPVRTAPPTEAVADTVPSDAQPMPATPTRTAGLPAGGAIRDSMPSEDRASSPNWIGWTLTGTGVVAIAGSGYLALRASSLDDQANRELDTRMRNDLRDQVTSRRLASEIIGASGLVLAGTGIYLLVTRSHHSDPRATASIDLGVTGSGIVVLGRF
jgi:hypothetical protein